MTLSEILANTPPAQTLAQATDVPGTNLEWMKTAAYPTGAWYGDLGELGTTGFRDSLFTGYLALGVTCKVSGVPYSWRGAGVGWVAVDTMRPDWQVIGPTLKSNYLSTPTTKIAVDTRKAHTTEFPISVVRLMYRNVGPDGTTFGELTNLSAIGTLTLNASIEFGTSHVPVLFNGQKICTIPPGSVVVSDPIFIGPVPANGVFYTRTHAVVSGGLSFVGCGGGYRSYEGVAYNGSDLSSGTGVSGYTTSTGDVQMPPFAILSKAMEGSTLYIGDSITQGVGDTGLIQDPKPPVFSWTRRCAAGRFPCYVAGYPGGRAGQFVDFARTPTLHVDLALLAFNRAVISFGANDCMYLTAGYVKNDIAGCITKLRSLGIQKIYVSLILPRTTSTDAWATIQNQTPIAGFEIGGVRDEVNSWIISLCGGKSDGFIDTLSDVASGPAWKPGATSDGAHPTSSGHASIAANAAITLT